MSTAIDPNVLVDLAKCFQCIPRGMQGDAMLYLLDQIRQGGSGGGGGGAVTIADGADVTLGAKADAASINTGAANTLMAYLKGLLNTEVNSNASLTQIDTDIVLVQQLLQGSGKLNVGGFTTVIKDATVVTAAAYSAGNAVGGKRTLANAVRTNGGTGILQSVTLLDRANQKAAMTLFIFDSDPVAATITDKTAFVFSTDDLKVIAQVNISAADYVTTNSKALVTYGGLAIPLKQNAAGTSLFAALVTTGTPTFAATTDVQLEVGILQD